jgi:integrase
VTKGDAAKAIQDIVDGKTAVDEKSLNKRGRAIVTGGAGVGRRTRTTAAAMYAWGIEHGHVRTNPFAGVKLAKPPVKERFLSPSEAARLLDVITARESEGNMHPAMADAVRLLILTGARKTEVCSLKWSEVDFERRVITLPPERTKAGGQNGIRHIRLSDPALLILHRRHESKGLESEFVFQSTRGQGPIVGLRKPYIAAREAAGLGGVRIHDLRHSFASFLIADGASLYLVSKMLGHASARTTERYAHLSDNPLQDAAASVAQIISQKSVIAKEK